MSDSPLSESQLKFNKSVNFILGFPISLFDKDFPLLTQNNKFLVIKLILNISVQSVFIIIINDYIKKKLKMF